jgi:transposase
VAVVVKLKMAYCADNVFRQKAVIKFLTKEGATAKNITDRLKIVYGENSLSYSTFKRWVVHFKNGNDDICDKPRSGRPPSRSTSQIFWDVHGVLLVEYLPKGETVNSARYQETLRKLAVAIQRKRPNLQNNSAS